jgi:hypothetical protein
MRNEETRTRARAKRTLAPQLQRLNTASKMKYSFKDEIQLQRLNTASKIKYSFKD